MIKNEIDYLLTGSFKYVWYRLRFFLVRTIYLASLRWVEFSTVVSLWKPSFSILFLVVRYLAEIFSYYRWGNLEQVRQQLAKLTSDGGKIKKYGLIQKVWGQSLTVSYLLLGGSLVVFVMSWYLKNKYERVLGLTISVMLLQIALTWAIKAIQSFVYSQKRIYRPFWTMVLIDTAPTAIIVFTSGKFGLYTLPLALLFETILKSSISAYLSYSAYRQMGLGKLRLRPRMLGLKWRSFVSGRNYLLSEILLLLVLSWVGQFFLGLGDDRSRALFIYVFFPVLTSVFSIRFLFYVDFIRFQSPVFTRVYQQVQRGLQRATLYWSFACYVVLLVALFSLGLITKISMEVCLGAIAFMLWAYYFQELFNTFIRGESWKKDLLIWMNIATIFFSQGPLSFWSIILLVPLVGIFVTRSMRVAFVKSHSLIVSLPFLCDLFGSEKECLELKFASDMSRDKMKYVISILNERIQGKCFFVLLPRKRVLVCAPNRLGLDEIIQSTGHKLLLWQFKKLTDFIRPIDQQQVVGHWRIGRPLVWDGKTDGSFLNELIKLVRGDYHQSSFRGFYFIPEFEAGVLVGLKIMKKDLVKNETC